MMTLTKWFPTMKIYSRTDVDTATNTGENTQFKFDTNKFFVDCNQAYDSKCRDKLLTAMYVLGIPAKLVNMCRFTLAGTKSLVEFGGEKSEPFIITKGLKQDNGLSFELIFNIYYRYDI